MSILLYTVNFILYVFFISLNPVYYCVWLVSLYAVTPSVRFLPPNTLRFISIIDIPFSFVEETSIFSRDIGYLVVPFCASRTSTSRWDIVPKYIAITSSRISHNSFLPSHFIEGITEPTFATTQSNKLKIINTNVQSLQIRFVNVIETNFLIIKCFLLLKNL